MSPEIQPKSFGTFKKQGPVSRKSRKFFGPEKPFVKLRPAYSLKLVFLHIVKGMKIRITATYLNSRRLRFEDTKRIMSPEIRPKSLGTFEKRAPGPWRGAGCLQIYSQRNFRHESSVADERAGIDINNKLHQFE